MHGGIILTKEEEEKNVLNKNNKPEINRGVELLLRNRRNVQPKPTFQLKLSLFKREITFTINITKKIISGGSMETLIVTLTITTCVSFLALLLGGVIGWVAREHSYETTPDTVYTHPEMFDENGNLRADEILAVRFENYDNNNEEEDND